MALAGSEHMQSDRKLGASFGRGVASEEVKEGSRLIYAAATECIADYPNGYSRARDDAAGAGSREGLSAMQKSICSLKQSVCSFCGVVFNW